MTNRVKNNDIPISTIFGGVCAVPNACRNKDITTIILIKDVIIINNDGNKVKAVIKTSTWSVRLYSETPDESSVILSIGKPCCAKADVGVRKMNICSPTTERAKRVDFLN